MPKNLTNTPAQPTLALSFEDVGRLRVRPAELARMLGVTRQSVSQWIQSGKITLGADGRVDPAKATRQVIENSDPSRLRARVLRSAVEDVGTLHRQIADLEHRLAAANARIEYLDSYIDEEDLALEILLDLLVARAEDFCGASDVPARRAFVQQVMDDASLMAGGRDPAAPVLPEADSIDDLDDIGALAALELADLAALDLDDGAPLRAPALPSEGGGKTS